MSDKTNGIGELANLSFDEVRQWFAREFPDGMSEEDKKKAQIATRPTNLPEDGNLAPPAPEHRRIVIGTLSYDARMHCAHAFALMQFGFAIAREGWELSFVLREGDSMVARGRNVLVAKFLEDPKNTDLFLIDTDLDFSPETAMKLCRAPVDLIGGCYPFKDEHGQFPLRWPVDGLFEKDGLWEVMAITPGFMRITRKALERMCTHLPHLAYIDNALGENRTSYMLFDNACRQNGVYDEGYIFCEHWRTLGGKVYIDPTADITHIGMKKYNHGTVIDWLERTAANVKKLKHDFPHVPDLDLVSFCSRKDIRYEAAHNKYSNKGETGAPEVDAGAKSTPDGSSGLSDASLGGPGRPTDVGLIKAVAQGLAASREREGAGGQPGGEVR